MYNKSRYYSTQIMHKDCWQIKRCLPDSFHTSRDVRYSGILTFKKWDSQNRPWCPMKMSQSEPSLVTHTAAAHNIFLLILAAVLLPLRLSLGVLPMITMYRGSPW